MGYSLGHTEFSIILIFRVSVHEVRIIHSYSSWLCLLPSDRRFTNWFKVCTPCLDSYTCDHLWACRMSQLFWFYYPRSSLLYITSYDKHICMCILGYMTYLDNFSVIESSGSRQVCVNIFCLHNCDMSNPCRQRAFATEIS